MVRAASVPSMPPLELSSASPLKSDSSSTNQAHRGRSLGLVGAGGLSPFVASKHGVIGLTKSVAPEVAGRGVRWPPDRSHRTTIRWFLLAESYSWSTQAELGDGRSRRRRH
jgi:hypothetical protein